MTSIITSISRLAGTGSPGLGIVGLVSLAHGATHWVNATFYVLLPFIAREFGLSYAETGSLMTLFFVTTFFTNVTSGPVVDLTARYVWFLVASLLIGGAALIVLGFAEGPVWVVAVLVLIGISISMWHPPSITYLSRVYPETRGFALSIHTVGASFGDVIAPPVAGLLMTMLVWRETAFITALPLFAMAILVLVVLRELKRPAREPGAASVSRRYLDGARLLVRDRVFLRLCLLSGLWSMSQNGIMVFLPLYLVNDLGAGPAALGIALAAVQIGAMFTGPVAGAWSDRVGRRPVVLAALSLAAVALAVMPFVQGIVAFTVVVAIFGCAMFSMRPVIHGWTMDLTGARTSGSAVSMVFAVQGAMTAALPALGGNIADVWGLAAVFHLMTVSCLAAVLIALSMPNSPAASEPAPA